jgi:hypothetical protein
MSSGSNVLSIFYRFSRLSLIMKIFFTIIKEFTSKNLFKEFRNSVISLAKSLIL